jgi:phospholipid-binding lipoprotein MlaA
MHHRHLCLAAGGLLLVALAGACTRAVPGADFNDPYEQQNRAVHDQNKALDRFLFGAPDRKGVVPTLPVPVADGLGNLAANLGEPGDVVNSLLQGRLEPVVTNTFRFVINTTVGIGGIFDPATALGLPENDTDFGQTLAVWGAGEGAYLELPILGPSTERDLAGMIVDFALDPVAALAGPENAGIATAARLGSAIGSRQRYSDTVESILYESADSYAQARLLYLQNRRFQLGEETDEFDPFEDPYAE